MRESDELPYADVVNMKCPTTVKTLEMLPVSKQQSISKMLLKPSLKTANAKVIINTELLKNIVLAASTNSNLDKVMYPVTERNESIELGIEATDENGETTMIGRESITEERESKIRPTEVTEDRNLGVSTEKFSHVELEPMRRSVYAVRQRNRQFFNSVPEDINETDDEQSSSEEKLRKITMFTRKRSLQNLYVEDTEPQQSDDNENTQVDEKETASHESNLNLLNKVKVYKPLRRVNSSPELHTHLTDGDNNQGFTTLSHADSLDHLKRKISLSQGSVDAQTSPGYAFLASVVESLRGRQTKAMAVRADMTVSKINPKLKTDSNEGSTSENISANKRAAQVIEKAPVPINVDMIQEKPIKSLMRSVYEWGTTSKKGVSNKEMNMYSPVSF